LAKTRFEAVDAVRGVAAMSVVVYHLAAYAYPAAPLSGGYLAVDLFFVLSGFVLSHAYGQRLEQGLSTPRFMLLRLVRLWPAYLIGILAGIAFALAQAPAAKVGLAALCALLFIPLPLDLGEGRTLFPLNLPAWSLFFELGANLAFVLFYRFLTGRTLLALLAVSAVGLVIVAIRAEGLHAGWAPDNFVGGGPRAIYGFFAGVLIQRRWPEGLNLGPAPALLALACLLVPVAIPLRAAFDVVVVTVVFPLCAAALAGATLSPRVGKMATTMGVISYPLYVIHMPFVPWVRHQPLVGLILLLVASYLIGRFYEPPVRAFLARRLLGKVATA